jgi:hypothetical protein
MQRRQGCPDKELHQNNPVTLRPEEVNQRTPEWFNDPRKIEPAGVKGDVRVRDAEALVENH